MPSLIDSTPGLRDYLTCALWSSTGEDGEPLDRAYVPDNFAPIALLQAHRDYCQAKALADAFVPGWRDYWACAQFGHDFWLTRNGHGAGFWDRAPSSDPIHTEIGEKLATIARTFVPLDPYVGDDGWLYFA